MEVPAFLRREGEALVYNGDGELVFYIPDEFFSPNSKIANIQGQYVSMLGICNYALFNKDEKQHGEVKAFHFPTIMLCKPDRMETVKNLKLTKTSEATDYRLLHFKDGDEVITNVRAPKLIDNAEILFSMFLITGKIPTTIPYDKLHEYFPENASLNGFSYNMNMQLFGVIISKICRDPNDLSKPFRLTNMDNMNGYRPISVKEIPNYTSPYVAITSENFDESLMAAITTKSDKYSPLEKILTM